MKTFKIVTKKSPISALKTEILGSILLFKSDMLFW